MRIFKVLECGLQVAKLELDASQIKIGVSHIRMILSAKLESLLESILQQGQSLLIIPHPEVKRS